jgi:iron complex transport system permease protein
MKDRTILCFILLSLLLVILFVASLLLGSVSLQVKEVLGVILGQEVDPQTRILVTHFRLPKAITALIVGAALSASGLQMQTLFRNPLAGPYVLGISSGASLGVSLFLLGAPLLGVSVASETLRNIGVVGSAWIGAALILAVIMAVSVRLKDIMAILILGMMFGSAASAIVQILQYLSPDSALKSFVVWTMGSLSGVSLQQLGLMSGIVVAGLALSIYLIKPLNLLLLGENYARTMGLNIRWIRFLLFASTTLLAGTVTAFCGPIGFIGIAVPHVARMLTGNADHRVLMPASMLMGSVTMLLCDIIAQLPGHEMVLPVNTITALLGIPIIVLVIVRNRKIF